MATITLTGNTLYASLGIGGFTNLGIALSKAKKKTSNLYKELNSLENKIDNASIASNLDNSKQLANNAKNREKAKKTSLSLVYDKLDDLILNVGIIDNKVAVKVNNLKNDFYSKYNYLKPECEKGFLEKLKDGAKKLFNSICNLESAINDFALSAVEWCKGKWHELLNSLGRLLCTEAVGTIVTTVVGLFDKIGGYEVIKALAESGTWLAWIFEKNPSLAAKYPIHKFYADATKRFFYATLGAEFDAKDGVYHIRQDSWQQYVHYSTGYDNVFISALNKATGGRLTVDAHQSDIFWVDLDGNGEKDKGEEFIIWSWKGDYTNLGAGAETGIYQVIDGKKDENGNYIKYGNRYDYIYAGVNRDFSVKMTLELYYDSNKDGKYSTDETLYKYEPTEEQWWITGFDPKTQNVKAENLKAVTTIDFSSYGEEQGRLMYNAFKEENYEYDQWEHWNDEGLTVTLNWEG